MAGTSFDSGNRVMILKEPVQTAQATPIRIISANQISGLSSGQLSNGQSPQIVQLIAQHVNPVNNLVTIIPANQVSSSRPSAGSLPFIQSTPNIKVKTPRKFVLATSSAQISQGPITPQKRPRSIATRFSPQQPIRSVHREILPKPIQTGTIQGTSSFGRMVALERPPVQYIIQSGSRMSEPVNSQTSFGYHSAPQLIYTTDIN